jgi:PAS domain-containing protein
MSLRARLVLAQLPLLLATALTIVFALWAAGRLAARPSAMLDENLRSLDAATTMLDALARLEAEGAQAEAATQAFEQALALQRSNVTEPGEDLATDALHDAWQRVRGRADPAAADLLALREAIEAILAINRAAMRSKAEQLRRDARRETVVIALVGLLGLALALPLGLVLLRRTLRPLRVLAAAVRRLARDDFEVRVHIEPGMAEIDALAHAFNQLAARLAAFRACSLGDLIEANERMQAIVDSLGDAVLVCDLAGIITQHNAAATQLLGAFERLDARDDPLGVALREVFDRVVHTRRGYEPRGLADAIELEQPGGARYLALGAAPVLRDDRLVAVTLALRDVTRVRRLDAQRSDVVVAALEQLRPPLLELHTAIHLSVELAASELDTRTHTLLLGAREACERLDATLGELHELAQLR